MTDNTEPQTTYSAFSRNRLIATGPLPFVLASTKQHLASNSADVRIFNEDTGKAVDFDMTGTLDEVIARHAALPGKTGPGRPKLGVVSREVSLLPRHWDWLEEQSAGISGALRRLVEQAMKAQPGKQRAQRAREALSRFLYSMAGDRPNYEEAARALFAGDLARFEQLVHR